MERAFKIGCRVVFFDSHRVAHDAIVTNWFHGGPDGQTFAEWEQSKNGEGVTSPLWTPCCNLVWVSEDKNKTDPYGRQLERQTSCSYGQPSGFLGQCWAWPDEEEQAKSLAAEAYAKSVAR